MRLRSRMRNVPLSLWAEDHLTEEEVASRDADEAAYLAHLRLIRNKRIVRPRIDFEADVTPDRPNDEAEDTEAGRMIDAHRRNVLHGIDGLPWKAAGGAA